MYADTRNQISRSPVVHQTDGTYKKLTLTHVISDYLKFKSVVTMPIV